MSGNRKNQAYRPVKIYSDEYWEIYHALVPILEAHFKGCEKFKADEQAHNFLVEYSQMRQNLWTREQAEEALDELRIAIVKLVDAYDMTPYLVLRELSVNHDEVLQKAKKEFMKTTKRDLFFWSMVDLPDVHKATTALKDLCDEREGLLSTIEMTRRALPEGFSTRNRPLQEWALIETCVCLVREFDAMNVPKQVGRTGPLFRLLRDVFEVFGITKGDFTGVYRGWRDKVDGKFKGADLLTI